jgi:UvrD-like helicase C-terminal domain
MSDASVHDALRSPAKLVVVEAPGGCGKTHQGAAYARDIAGSLGPGRLLILTHTHAACSVFHSRTRGLGSHVEIRTIDSLVSELTEAYYQGIGLPPDTAAWARRHKNGHDHLAVKAAALIRRFPAIGGSLAQRYPVVICDEHQDSSGERHAIVMSLRDHGALLRVFADPMQQVFEPTEYPGGCPPLDWQTLIDTAEAFERLDFPHRWNVGCQLLGKWIVEARETLKAGGVIDLTHGLPPSLSIVLAENAAQRNLEYRPAHDQRAQIDAFERAGQSLLILARYGDMTRSLRPTFNRRIPLWAGHVRSALEDLVAVLSEHSGDRDRVATAMTDFIQATTTGFSASEYGDIFLEDVANRCSKRRRGNRAAIQEIAQFVVNEPNHIGAAKVLARIVTDNRFGSIQLDCSREFHEGARLGDYQSAEVGFREIARCRTYTRPHPPQKAISTIHKAKGLECKNVIVMPCDAKSFGDNTLSRCLLYVAISRASERLMLVIPPSSPSPLFRLHARN